MFTEEDPYVQFLADNSGKTVYLKPWRGNAGDTLIWLGTENLLHELSIRTTRDPEKADLILIPGGNQTMWQANVDIWKKTWAAYRDKEFAVGPMTVQPGLTSWVEDIRRAPVRIAGLFARDTESYAHLQKSGFAGDVALGLSHDPALYLRDSDLVRAEREAASQEFVLAVFRNDHEGSRTIGEYRRGLSRLMPKRLQRWLDTHRKLCSQVNKTEKAAAISAADGPFWAIDIAQDPIPYFFEVLRAAKVVHTDRLHCMLAAVMLGKRVYAYPTTFGKLEAVYEHSLAGWADVEFVRDF